MVPRKELRKMKFIVPIGYLRAAMIAQARDDIRYYINGIHFKGNKIESTNGHIAYQATLNQGLNDVCNELDKTITEDCQVPDDLIIKIDGKIPATTRKRNIAFAKIELEDKNKVLIRYLDYMNTQVDVGHGDVVEGRFPDLDKALAAWFDNAEVKSEAICLNPQYLRVVDEIAKTCSMSYASVKMEITNKDGGVKFSFNRLEHIENKENLIVLTLRQ